MSKCPICKEEIHSVLSKENTISTYSVKLEEDYKNDLDDDLNYELIDTDSSVCQDLEYLCPKCNKVIFYKEYDVVKFLNEEVSQC